jgi:hypothetical protein
VLEKVKGRCREFWIAGKDSSVTAAHAAHEGVGRNQRHPPTVLSTPSRPITGGQVAGGGVCTAAAKTPNGEAGSRHACQTVRGHGQASEALRWPSRYIR